MAKLFAARVSHPPVTQIPLTIASVSIKLSQLRFNIFRTIRLNTELAKKPKEYLEYIVAHEMVHLLERTHGPRFLALMDRFMPNWRDTRELLNRLPARHERWNY
jgi:predicted metal-dependent hydrolase